MAALSLGHPAGVLLDLDGTLLDSEPVHRAAYELFFAARGWEVDDATYTQFVGRRGADVFAALPGPWTGEDPDALVAEILGHLPTVGVAPVAARGAVRLVRALHARRVPLALVTSATTEWAERALGELLGVRDCFSALVTWEAVADGKPHPEPYALGCRLLGVAPADAVAVEDSVAGVTSAVAAGVGRVIALTTTSPAAPLRDAGAHDVAADLDALGAS